MFDLRYHVASLAAVFLALAIGIILGVAISGKVKGAESSFASSELNRLQGQLTAERDAATMDRERLAALETFVERSYTPLMQDRLQGRSFAVVFLGPVDGGIRGAVASTLQDAGAGGPTRLVALDVPVDPKSLDDFLGGRDGLAKYAGDDFSALGHELGSELADGAGDNPVLTQVSSELVEERSGSMAAKVDGIVVARTWEPSADGKKSTNDATGSLLDGIVSGLQAAGLPTVGVVSSTEDQLQAVLDGYGSAGLSSVNDLDFPTGRVALALLLQGAEPGSYGFGADTDGPIPPVLPVASAP